MLVRYVLGLILLGLLSAAARGAGEKTIDRAYAVPRFRHVDLDTKPPKHDRERLALIADADLPPFSYSDASGNPKGLAVDLALALCTKLGLRLVKQAVAKVITAVAENPQRCAIRTNPSEC